MAKTGSKPRVKPRGKPPSQSTGSDFNKIDRNSVIAVKFFVDSDCVCTDFEKVEEEIKCKIPQAHVLVYDIRTEKEAWKSLLSLFKKKKGELKPPQVVLVSKTVQKQLIGDCQKFSKYLANL